MTAPSCPAKIQPLGDTIVGNDKIKTGADDDLNVLDKVVEGRVEFFSDQILRSIFFLSFANVATFFNEAGTKLDFWTFAKDFDENGKFQNSSIYFHTNFLAKLK